MIDFSNHPHAHLFMLISNIHLSSKRIIESKIKPIGLTWPQFTVLAALSQQNRIPQRQLGEIVESDSTNIMVICDSLEKKGYINRIPNPSDRRSNLIILTDKGKEKAWEATPQLGKHIQLYSSILSLVDVEDMISKLTALLSKIKSVGNE